MKKLLSLSFFGFLVLTAGLLSASPVFADYTVTGKFQYEDREFGINGFTGTITPRPIRFADVRIIITGTSTTLATGATNASGDFSIVVPGSTAQSISALCVSSSTATPGLLLDIKVANNDFTFGDLYSFASTSAAASGSGTVSIGTTLATAASDVGKVFNIWDCINDGLDFVASSNANGSRPTVRLTAIWRATHTSTGSFFSGGSTKFLYMGVNAPYDDTIITHEFGHYVDNLFSKSDSPGGSHFLGDNNQDIRLSWGEGLATFLGSSIRAFKGYPRPDIYVNTDGTNLSFSYEIETLLGGTASIASRTGSTNEVAVSAVLWDITDGTTTADETPSAEDTGDTLTRPFLEVWRVLNTYLPTVTTAGITVEDFWDGWFSAVINNGNLAPMQTVFATLNGIEFIADLQEPDGTSGTAKALTINQVPALVAGSKVLITEVDLGSPDQFELYNAGNTAADISGWRVTATRPGFVVGNLVLPSFTLAPGAFVIVSENSGTNTNSKLFLGTNNIPWLNGDSGSCALADSTGAGKDFVRWGTSSESPPSGTTFTGTNPAAPPVGKTLARNAGNADTDAGADWTSQNPSLGDFNISTVEKHYTFYPTVDVDFASFNATSGRNYVIYTYGLANGADTVMELLSTDGTTVLSTNDDSSSGTQASKITWTAPSTGTYFIRVKRFEDQSAMNFAQYGSYDLRMFEISSTAPVLSFTSIFPQVAVGAEYRTLIVGVNTSASATAAVDVSLTKSNGTSFPVTVEGVTNSTFSRTISPMGTSRLESTSSGGVTVGYAKFLSSVALYGSALFKTLNGTVVTSEAGVGLATPTKSFTVYIDNLNNAVSGYAVANSGTTVATLTLSLRSKNGIVLETKSVVLPAGQHISEFAFQRFPANAPAGFEGSIEFSSDQNVTAVALRFDNATEPVFSTIPVLVNEMATTLYFPQVADGGSYRTNFILVNPSNTATSATLEFFAPNGSALSLPIDGVMRTGHVVPLSAKGVARFVTDGTSSGTKVGWVRVTCPVAIGGSAIFQTVVAGRITSEAGVSSSPVASHFTTYVESLGPAESGLAVANCNSATVTVTFNLRNSGGQIVATTTRTLLAFQHQALFFTQLFPSGFGEFEGTLELVSTMPVSGVALRYDNAAQNVFATLPVIVIP
jgi:hypothetical protein